MTGKVFWLCSGLAGGVVVALVTQALVRPEEPGERADLGQRAAVERVTELTERNARLEDDLAEARREAGELAAKVAALEEEARKAKHATPAAPPKPAPQDLKDEEILKEVGAFGSALRDVILGDGAPEQVARIRELFEKDGPRVLTLLTAKFRDDTADIGLRTVIAHAMAQSGDPHALKVLEATLSDPEAGMLQHRFASHALAFANAKGVETILARVAHDEAMDGGARANASFGLARRGSEEGIALYAKMTDGAIEKGDPAGLQYLGGFALLGKKADPVLRARLETYKEPQALLLVIELLKDHGDKASVPALEKIAYDAGRPESVRRAAEAALKVLGQP